MRWLAPQLFQEALADLTRRVVQADGREPSASPSSDDMQRHVASWSRTDPEAKREARRRCEAIYGAGSDLWRANHPDGGGLVVFLTSPVSDEQWLFRGLADVHADWSAAIASWQASPPHKRSLRPLLHPIAPLVRSWLDRPPRVEANDRPDPILPGLILPDRTGRRGKAAALFALEQRSATARGFLPGVAPGDVDGEQPPRPSVPLALWDLAAGSATSSRGAPLAARIFVESALDVGRERWGVSADKGVTLPPERLRDFLRRLYPTSRKWHRRRQLPGLLRAFDLLAQPSTRIEWHDPKTGDGGARWVVIPLDIPRDGRMDDWVRFSVHLPPGATDGPLIDRPALRRAGVQSPAAWRLVLALSADWSRPGKTRRPIGRGRSWIQRKDWKAYDAITDVMLNAMAFPGGSELGSRSAYRSRLQRGIQALAWLEAQGFADVKAGRNGRRVRPGDRWIGWGGAENG